MYVLPTKGVPIKAWADGVEFPENSQAQLQDLATMPFIHKHLAVMPDVHLGIGCSVGSVVPTKGAIIPAAVGVDIGCGMVAVDLGITADKLPDNLSEVRSAIEAAVPHGRSARGGSGDKGAWSEVPEDVFSLWKRPATRIEVHKGQKGAYSLADGAWLIKDRTGISANDLRHLGTLGTGNHFIELCVSDSNKVWVMLHSGSRGIGNAIGRHYIAEAQREMERYFIRLPNKDVAYITEQSPLFEGYTFALEWAQDFARFSREIMLRRTINAVRDAGVPVPKLNFPEHAVNCHHNYVAKEHHYGENVWVTRKGAVRARAGDLGIIPGSMGARSFIVRGLGNPESFHSCSHGAGRVMSRSQAKKVLTMEDHLRDTQGVECRKDEGVLDESPKAYKDIDAVMTAQSDLVEIVHELKQVVCVKG